MREIKPDSLGPLASSPVPLAAVLWDMDGTLIDTEPHWGAAETALVESFGGVWRVEDGIALVGNSMAVTAAALQERGVELSTQEIADCLEAHVRVEVAREVPWQPGAQELLRAVAGAGIPCALVTSSAPMLADPFAEGVGVFSAVVSSADVTHHKPHPMPYLLAAERLGVDIARCVVVEDSPAGLTAALTAGASVLAVQAFTPITAIAEAAGVPWVPTLAGLRVDDLIALAQGTFAGAGGTRH